MVLNSDVRFNAFADHGVIEWRWIHWRAAHDCGQNNMRSCASYHPLTSAYTYLYAKDDGAGEEAERVTCWSIISFVALETTASGTRRVDEGGRGAGVAGGCRMSDVGCVNARSRASSELGVGGLEARSKRSSRHSTYRLSENY